MAALDDATLAALRDVEITDAAIARAGGLGQAEVSVTGRLWMPRPGGELVVLQPVWSRTTAPCLVLQPEDNELLDLIVWRPGAPGEWFYRLGLPGIALGGDQLATAYTTGAPIRLHASPLEWLQAGCDGAVDLERVEPLSFEPRGAAA